MRAPPIPPTADWILYQWATDLSAKLDEAGAEFGVSPEQVAEMASRTAAYATALQKAKDPLTRGVMTLAAKQTKKGELLDYARQLARMIGGNPNVTDEQRLELGLRVRKPRTPQQPPTDQPDLDVLSLKATSVRFRAHNGDVLVRRLPAGVTGMLVWTWAGPVPPQDHLKWTLQGAFTRPTVTVDFGANIEPGSKVWIAVCWFNRHGQGPLSLPLETRLSGLTLSQQMAQQDGGLSLAA